MLVPKLRFKEFNYEWVSIVLKDIFNIFAGGDIEKEHCKSEKVPPFIFPIYANAIDKNGLYGYSDLYKVEGATLTVAGRGVNTGHAIARFEKYYPIVRLLILIPKIESNMYFYENLINTCKLFIESTGIPQLTVPQISSYKFLVPNKNEQDKIGKLFELLDKKIELQQRKINALKMYKKGLYQKIFSNIINYEKLGNLITQKSIRNKNYENYEVLSVSNKQGFILQNEQFEDREVASEDKSNYKIVSKNDFAFNPARINVGSIARLKNRENGIISPMYTCFQCKKELNCNYFEHLLNTDYMHREIIKRLEGSVRLCLSFEAMANIKIPFSDIENQKYLGDFLEKINKKINIIDKNRESLCTLKKGLLQQMFI